MRRARLKVTATVPIRRRVARENGQAIVTLEEKSDDTPPVITQSVPSNDGSNIECNNTQVSQKSTSESEDDSRRSSTALPASLEQPAVRALNDEQDSTANSSINTVKTSLNPTRSEKVEQNEKPNLPNNSTLNLPKVVVKAKRKMMVSESARKLAEARREFQLKHENKPPDRSQLRMYDFIHYNPTTNPMRKKSNDTNSVKTTVSSPIETLGEVPGEEDIDDPASNAMPVPQVKVGPDGQLIIDEQSLVIEHTGVKESRAALANQAVIIDDNDYGNGFYKRRKKTKEWPEWETIKFYKALNTVGTDFLLMQSLFPKRSRQELKIKFKKEERMNRSLVEKALKYSQEFDFDLLKKELESFEEPEIISPKPQLKQYESKNIPKQSRKRKQASRRIAAMSICEEDASEEVIYYEVDEPAEKSQLVDIIEPSTSMTEHSNTNDCHVVNDESDPEVYNVRPTRSGRQPKLKKYRTHRNHRLAKIPQNNDSPDTNDPIQAESSTENDDVLIEQISTDQGVFTLENDESSVADINSVEPGSLVIVSKESSDEPGETVVQVYMVSSDMENINLTESTSPIDIAPTSSPKVNNVSDLNATDELLQDLTDA